VLPAHHLDDHSRDTMKLGIGLVATLTALVLGLVTASTKSAFDDVSTTIKHAAVDALELDRVLARYGPETREIRSVLKVNLARRIDSVWSSESTRAIRVDVSGAAATVEGLAEQIRALTPQTAAQQSLQARALDQTEALLRRRWAVLAVLLVCALSVSSAVFLVLEMDSPFDGVIRVSPEPLRYAVDRLGR